MIVYWIMLLITAFLAYTIGSISTLRVASRFVFRRNLRRLGAGNVWISNFKRLYGYWGFARLLLVEVVKDLIPILIGGLLLGIRGHADVGRAFAGFCLMMGRLWPVFNGFRGSRGCVAMVVSALCIDVSMGIAAAVLLLAVAWFSRFLSLGAVAAAVAMILTAVLVLDERLLTLLSVFIALLIILRHVPAMLRLAQGKEERISFEEDITYKFDEKF